MHCRDLPRYATPGAAGLDLTAAIDTPWTLEPGKHGSLPTGLQVEIPPGYEGQVRARSGLAKRSAISLVNGIGTIDSDYRGEILLLLINHGSAAYTFEPGERIGQLILVAIPRIQVMQVEELDADTQRGSGGFGSTGHQQLGSP